MALPHNLVCLTALIALSSGNLAMVDTFRCGNEKECTCFKRDGMLTADCSGRNLTNFPKFADNIEIILLGDNMLEHFPNDSFLNLTHLKVLDLSHNRLGLQTRDEQPFSYLVNLQTLILHDNNIEYSMIGEDLFSSLVKLKELDLTRNMKTLSQPYPIAIAKCKSLRMLKLDSNTSASFDRAFQDLLSLEVLSLSGRYSNCHLQYIPSTFFKNLPKLQFIDISLCNVRNIELGTFHHLESLNFLNVSNNHYLTFRSLNNITTDLGHTNITTLDVSSLHCTFGVGTYLYKNDLIGLQNTSLRDLHIDQNRMIMVETGLISIFPQTLEYVSVVGNKLTMGMYLFELYLLKKLKIVKADFQDTSYFPDTFTNRFKDCKDWRGPDGVDYATQRSISHQNMLLEIKSGFQKKLCPSIMPSIEIPPNLQYFFFANSKLQYPVPCLQFNVNNNIKHIDLHNNVLSYWQGPIYGCNAEIVDLSYNLCSHVSKVFFRNCSLIKVLNISSNMIGFDLGQDNEGEILKSQTLLQHLNLSDNRISKLPSRVFVSLSSLEILDLSYNQLDNWTFDIMHMKNIRMINISNNEITSIPSPIRHQILSLRATTNLSIDLDRNKLQCTCDTVDFMEWIYNNRELFKNFNMYNCHLTNHSTMSFTELERYIPEVKRKCNSYIGLIFGAIAAVLTCIIILIGGLIYRYRWRLRYIYFLAKNKYGGFYNVEQNRDDDVYRYDAFVSYSDKDNHVIIKDVQHRIEEKRGFRLCFHQRDFIAGEDIATNITNAIQQSRKTVAILSRNYLNSYWCMFEFNMARMESIYSRDGKNVLFFVLYEDIPPRDLPLNMMDIIESQSYIEYPSDQLGDEVFWDKIAEAIQQ